MNISQKTLLALYGIVLQMEHHFSTMRTRRILPRQGESIAHAWARHIERQDADADWYERRAKEARDLILGIPDTDWDDPLPFDVDPRIK